MTKYEELLKDANTIVNYKDMLLKENIQLKNRVKQLEDYCNVLKPPTPVETTGWFSVELCTFGQTEIQNEELLNSIGGKIEKLLSEYGVELISWKPETAFCETFQHEIHE